MEHISLYRKYRPKTFEEVIGQDHITKTLQNQIMNNHIGHAYLFTGTRGTGKTSIAKIFAKAVNCLTPVHGSPCGKCENCLRLEKENDINIIEIDAASNNKVDDVREIRDKVKFLPVGAKYKVYIIDEVHMLTDSAFNALLKTLEEPPEHIIFILATTEAHKLPQTILSRCVRFDFHLVSVETLMKHLANIFDKEKLDRLIKYHIDRYKLNQLDSFVLGCTHYELVAGIFEKYCPNTQVIKNSTYLMKNINYFPNTDQLTVEFLQSKNSYSYLMKLNKLIRR